MSASPLYPWHVFVKFEKGPCRKNHEVFQVVLAAFWFLKRSAARAKRMQRASGVLITRLVPPVCVYHMSEASPLSYQVWVA